MMSNRRTRIFSITRPRATNLTHYKPTTRQVNQTKPVLKVSYCTTCYNRFWQLKQVVKHNITVINNSGNAEWIIVDFGGQDSNEMREWLINNCPKSLANGSLKYYRRTLPDSPFVWNVSVAKNVAHRLATGDILVNLDGDNFLQPNDPQIISALFQQRRDTILQQTWNNFLIYHTMNSLGRSSVAYQPFLEQYTGSNGRISLSRQNFDLLGGYDEEMLFMGYQDTDLLARAVLKGLYYLAKPPKSLETVSNKSRKFNVPYKSSQTSESIGNERTKPYANNSVKSWRQAEAHNRHLSFRKIRAHNLIANQTGFSENLEHYTLFK